MYSKNQKIIIASILEILVLIIIFGMHNILQFGIHIDQLFFDKIDNETYYADETHQFRISHRNDHDYYEFAFPDRQFSVEYMWEDSHIVTILFSDGSVYQGYYDEGVLRDRLNGMPLEWTMIFESDSDERENIAIANALCKVEKGKKELNQSGAAVPFFLGLIIYINSALFYIFPYYALQLFDYRRANLRDRPVIEPTDEQQWTLRKTALTFLIVGAILMLFARQIAKSVQL